MIGDDHEITDGYSHETCFKFNDIAVNEGTEMYKIYQQGLLDSSQSVGFVCKNINDDTTLILISRSFFSGDIIETLRSIKFQNNIIIAFSSAPLPMIKNISGLLYNSIFGNTGWSDLDLKDLYNFCFELLTKNHKVILIGGDIHIGVEGIITKNNLILPIFITSPITNHPTVVEYIYSKSLNGKHTFFEYQLYLKAKAKRNYLKIMLDDITNGNLVFSSIKKPKSYLTLIKHVSKFI
jgi:hypothetical protein